MSLLVEIEKDYGGFHLCSRFETNGGITGLLGPSGCGKSQTLRCIAGVQTPDQGRIVLDGVTLYDSEQHINLTPQQRGVGYLFQSYALFPTMTVYDNIAFGLKVKKAKKDEIDRKVREIARKVDLSDEQLKKAVSQLSGGQQQRVALARTLNQNPKIILADEPVASLDPITAKQVMQDFVRINKEYKISILLNIHHVDLALKYCDRVIGIRAGEIVFDGPASTITQEQIDEVYNGAKAPTMGEGEGELPKAARAEG